MSEIDVLLVGNYCHDTLIHSHGRYDVLGGSSSYISRALEASGVDYRVVAKVGADFRYHHLVPNPPLVSESHPTTHFVDDHSGPEMAATLRAIGEPISPRDLDLGGSPVHATVGLACGVAMEIMPETLEALHARCERVICDIQALIRVADPATGRVSLRPISQTPFRDLLDRIQILKANAREATYVDVPFPGELVITEAHEGARLLRPSGEEIRVPAYPAREIDPTGAGDSFVAGMALGFVEGMGIVEAIRLGNRFGAYCVETIGVPDFSKLTKLRAEEASASPVPALPRPPQRAARAGKALR